jgi:hypothetical protein
MVLNSSSTPTPTEPLDLTFQQDEVLPNAVGGGGGGIDVPAQRKRKQPTVTVRRETPPRPTKLARVLDEDGV